MLYYIPYFTVLAWIESVKQKNGNTTRLEGFNNARFGRIGAHIAVCDFDRQIILQSVKISERHGFRVLHGIVDSIWVKMKRNTKITTTRQDEETYARLQRSIEQRTGFTIPLKGNTNGLHLHILR